MATYCTKDDVLVYCNLVSEFNATRPPTTSDVDRFINQVSNEMNMEYSSGHIDIAFSTAYFMAGLKPGFPDTTPSDDSALESWLRDTAVQGVLREIGRQFYSYGPQAAAERVPWQEEYPKRIKQLQKHSLSIFPDADGQLAAPPAANEGGWQSGGATFRMDTTSQRLYVKNSLVEPSAIDPNDRATYDGYIPLMQDAPMGGF